MHDPNERFRRLRPPQSGDLFAHFGVPIESAQTEPLPAPVLARACTRCQWWMIRDAQQCEMCGAPLRALEVTR